MSDFKNKAGAAGAAIGDMAEEGLKTARATATAATGAVTDMATSILGRAKGLFGGGDDDAKSALQKLVAAQDSFATASAIGDEKQITAARQSLVEAWTLARKVAAED